MAVLRLIDVRVVIILIGAVYHRKSDDLGDYHMGMGGGNRPLAFSLSLSLLVG